MALGIRGARWHPDPLGSASPGCDSIYKPLLWHSILCSCPASALDGIQVPGTPREQFLFGRAGGQSYIQNIPDVTALPAAGTARRENKNGHSESLQKGTKHHLWQAGHNGNLIFLNICWRFRPCCYSFDEGIQAQIGCLTEKSINTH